MDIVLVLDLSGSVETVRDLIMEFAYQFTLDLPLASDLVRLSVINYADTPFVCFHLDTYTSKRGVLNALVAKFYGGRTGTESALRTMYEDVFTSARGDRASVDNYAIVVSDGRSNINRDRTIPEARMARSRGVNIYSVAVGESPSMGEMEGIANTPSSEYTVRLATADDVKMASDELMDHLCT